MTILNNPTLGIKKLHPDAIMPSYAHAGDSGLSLHAIEDVTLQPGAVIKINTGIALEIPKHFEVQLRPRSSMAAKGIIIPNSPATLDQPYRGLVIVMFINLSDDPYKIKKGDNIANMVLAPVATANIVEVENLTETSRSFGGFGSTGK